MFRSPAGASATLARTSRSADRTALARRHHPSHLEWRNESPRNRGDRCKCRSSTGFLAPEAFELQADRFFESPNDSTRGWESAADAQTRIVSPYTISSLIRQETPSSSGTAVLARCSTAIWPPREAATIGRSIARPRQSCIDGGRSIRSDDQLTAGRIAGMPAADGAVT